MVFRAYGVPALALAVSWIIGTEARLAAAAAADSVAVKEQTMDVALPDDRPNLLRSSRKVVARTGEAVMGIATTTGRFVGSVIGKIVDGIFDNDGKERDPVRASRDADLNQWTESRDKWLRQSR